MSLHSYKKKRNFNKTSEPKGKIKKTQHQNLYVIQKHAASHLHYDFRLELNGVLVSWAVPKGPSLDPAVKRLAMHVEDHPLEYGSFQGIIPQGEYGGGTVMLWDKGQWFPDIADVLSAYQKGTLSFRLKGKKLKGKWKLIRINENDKTWLLIKVKDAYAKDTKDGDVLLELPNSVISNESLSEIAENNAKVWGQKNKERISLNKSYPIKKKHLRLTLNLSKTAILKDISPQLATLVEEVPSGNEWLHEIKFDGYRLLIYKNNKKVVIYTRNQHNWTKKFKMLAKEIQNLPIKNIILDGEVVMLDENHHSNFQLLQNALQAKEDNFIFYAFDLLYYDEFNLMNQSLLERKNILRHFIDAIKHDIIQYSDYVIGNGVNFFKEACRLGLEGIISKNIHSFYTQKRDVNWLKIKCSKRQEFVIGGFLKSKRQNYFRSLMLGTFNHEGKLIYHGNVGTGFTNSSLKMIHHLLLQHISSEMPFNKKPRSSKEAIWVKPLLIAEVEFREWTHSSALRHPSFKGIRGDKNAKTIIKEEPLPMPKKNILKPLSKPIKNEFLYLTHPDKILYPEDKITKLNVAEYYSEISHYILPFIKNRPLTFVRCPNNYKKCFFQKHLNQSHIEGLQTVLINNKENNKEEYFYLTNKAGLMSMAQLGVLEIHPWGSRISNLLKPDILIFDLDPGPEVKWLEVVNAAYDLKKIFNMIKLNCYVKTTGGKGLHVVIPIKPHYEWESIKQFSQVIVEYMVSHSDHYISKMTKSARVKKIFIDYFRNQRGATAIAPYGLRARLHAPVATPLFWDELSSDIRDVSFNIKTIRQRLNNLKENPWQDFFMLKQAINLKDIKINFSEK